MTKIQMSLDADPQGWRLSVGTASVGCFTELDKAVHAAMTAAHAAEGDGHEVHLTITDPEPAPAPAPAP